jgi:hypothetical protein
MHQKLLADAKNHIVTIEAHIGVDFVPSGRLDGLLASNELRDKYKGLMVDALRIRGQMAAQVDYVSRVQWWNKVKKLITHLGFEFTEHAELTCEPLAPGSFSHSAGHNVINFEHLVIHGHSDGHGHGHGHSHSHTHGHEEKKM